MNVLLDTCTFLWIISDSPELSLPAREVFQSPANDVYLSSVSTWEIAVKHSLGRLPLPQVPQIFVPEQRKCHGVASLLLSEEATLNLPKLPDWHRDPFDRMLICQALSGNFTLLTPDAEIHRYPVNCCW
ncbi:MAG: twitching motility protein PilT [Deltaproteobacteria bacterium RIFOXYA12_FULL_58_15]|nr:MAG: twitching motility protein PilT [Deltaproteobacteria bacterium RIFOXYA12_FULL_58_15]